MGDLMTGPHLPPLTLKRAKVSRPSGHWGDDDYDVICEGAVFGAGLPVTGCAAGPSMDVDAGLRLPRRQHTDAWIQANTRSRDGGVREELAEG
jgi:hypothetical protein